MTHPNSNVNAALIRLNDALCSMERNSGPESVLILRDDRGFVDRSFNGKPIPENVSDEVLLLMVQVRQPVFTGVLEERWIKWGERQVVRTNSDGSWNSKKK
jgi:hypothetical protein